MKKTLIAASLLGLASGSAFASKARLTALGQNTDDNFYVKDSRSVFYNAAYVNHFANMMITEWGADSSSLDTSGSPKAEGGAFKTAGNMTYGVYFGNESNTGALVRLAAESTDNDLLKADNVLNLFVAGDAWNMKWGAGFLYSNNKEEYATPTNDKEESNMAVRLGAIGSNWEGFANVSLKGESKTKESPNPQEFNGDLGLHVGGAYLMGDNKFVVSYKTLSWKQKNALHTTEVEGSYSLIHAGFGNTKDLGSGTTILTQLYYEGTTVEGKFTSNPAELKHMVVPVTVGFETKANDWLTWRGSVKHNLLGTVEQKNILRATAGADQNVTNTFAGTLANVFGTDAAFDTAGSTKKGTLTNKTTVAGGASLVFGKMSVDGSIGTTTTGGLNFNTLLTRVGVNYWF